MMGKVLAKRLNKRVGDQVEIETSDRPTVLPKWLEWAITPRARNSIRRYLRSKVKQSKDAKAKST